MSTRTITAEALTALLAAGDAFSALERDLARTAVLKGERVDAALALHKSPDAFCAICVDEWGSLIRYPCPTALALGVES